MTATDELFHVASTRKYRANQMKKCIASRKAEKTQARPWMTNTWSSANVPTVRLKPSATDTTVTKNHRKNPPADVG